MGSTWGTARDLTASNVGKALHGLLTPGGGYANYSPRDVGFGNFETADVRLALSLTTSITSDIAYDEIWLQLLAAGFGTTTAVPAETTVGQGDYLHNIDVASNITGKFVTMAWLTEDDYANEYPSVAIHTIGMQSDVNNVGTFTCQGIPDNVVPNASAVNNATDVAGLSYASSTFRPGVLGATNHYLRLNAQAGAGLASGDDKRIIRWSLSLTRPETLRHSLRGTNSPYTEEPTQPGPHIGTFSIQLAENDDSVYDVITAWKARTEFKAELYMDGDQIGTGLNRSIKIQLARLSPAPGFPEGIGLPNNNSLIQPVLNFKILQASAAPTGMTGVQFMRVAQMGTRIQSYFN